MPYISKLERTTLEPDINCLISKIKYVVEKRPDKIYGVLNYTICMLLTRLLKPENGWTYSSLSHMLGVPADVLAELRRTLLDVYEQDKSDMYMALNEGIPELQL